MGFNIDTFIVTIFIALAIYLFGSIANYFNALTNELEARTAILDLEIEEIEDDRNREEDEEIEEEIEVERLARSILDIADKIKALAADQLEKELGKSKQTSVESTVELEPESFATCELVDEVTGSSKPEVPSGVATAKLQNYIS